MTFSNRGHQQCARKKLQCNSYHAVGNYYLKYSWEYSMHKKICITHSFIVENPNILGNFLLFVGQDQLGENCLTYSGIWASQNTIGKKYALHIREIQATPNKSCMQPPAWYLTSLPQGAEKAHYKKKSHNISEKPLDGRVLGHPAGAPAKMPVLL